MPFQKGQSGNPDGRKGYMYEKAQLEKMRKLLDGYLILLDTAIKDADDEKTAKKLNLIGADLRKIMDKLHASKTETKHEGEIRLPVRIIHYVKPSEPVQAVLASG